jgi:predicted negative regulator of RcsB-dependent stress response
MALLTLLRACGDDALADAARIDLATLALDAGELEAARRYLDEIRGSAVAAPAAHLQCRIALAALPAAEREVARAQLVDCAGLPGLGP